MEHKVPDYSQTRSGPGENGKAVILTGKEALLGDKQMKTWFMNVVASDKIDMDRSIVDSRSAECKAVRYDYSSLPRVSVVIIFTDEAWTPLLRTVHSVVNRSPPSLLHEVILIDDFSQREELKEKLSEYVKRFGGLVKLIRKRERQGLIRAKLAGAREASAEVVVFLDSHCEANTGWLEPIVQRIKEKKSAVVCPVIDMISAKNMAYMGGSLGGIGTFWWSLHFKMDPIPEREQKRRKSVTDPLMSPTMAGGLLAADREYFFEVGGYDSGMDIWGGENLEISFRVWMCGGSIEFLPCSHVGHIFRDGHPYNMTGSRGEDVHGINSKRLADVWMDDYKRLFYVHRMGLKETDAGDISDRIRVRQKLNCHSFKWYLDNIIPEKFIPDENVKAYGLVMNKESDLCLDTLQRLENKGSVILGLFSCQHGGSSSQAFSLSMDDQLRRETTCADNFQQRQNRVDIAKVILINCSQSHVRKWKHEQNGQILHMATGLCLDVEGIKSGDDVLLSVCDNAKSSQKWTFSKYF